MKKLILTFIFVIATGTSFVNASSFKNIDSINCVAFAFEVEEVLGYEMTYEKFSRTVDNCDARYN